MRSSQHFSTELRSSILTLEEDKQSGLTEQEQANMSVFREYAKNYSQRIAWPLSGDHFQRGLKEVFETHKVRYARVPFAGIDTVYYFFTKPEHVKLMLDFVVGGAEQVPASAVKH